MSKLAEETGKVKDSGSCRQMMLSCKSPISKGINEPFSDLGGMGVVEEAECPR